MQSALNLLNLREIYLTLHKYGKVANLASDGSHSSSDIIDTPLSNLGGTQPNNINTFVVSL